MGPHTVQKLCLVDSLVLLSLTSVAFMLTNSQTLSRYDILSLFRNLRWIFLFLRLLFFVVVDVTGGGRDLQQAPSRRHFRPRVRSDPPQEDDEIQRGSLRFALYGQDPLLPPAASLVNISLEKQNKEHVAGALFSLHENKMVIGVLGAVEPLRARARQDAALALYPLSLIPSNMTRLVRAGAVATLLSMVRSGESTSRILLVFCNLAACPDGKGAMLDRNAVAILVGKLREESGGGDKAVRAVLLTLC
ncbi:hypothetical protein Bca4012_051545 [Brassica carinata]